MRRAIYSSFILLSIAAVLIGCTQQKEAATATPTPGSARMQEVSPPTPEPSEPKTTLSGERFTIGRLNLKPGDRIEQEYAARMTIAGALSGRNSNSDWIRGKASGGVSETVSWETEVLAISEGRATELCDRITRARQQSVTQGTTTYSKDFSENEAKRSPLEGKTVHHRKGIRAWQASVEDLPESEATGLEANMSGRTLDPLLNGLFPRQPVPVGHTWTLTGEQADGMVDTFPFDTEVSNSLWDTDSQATATFKEVTDYEGERCALILIRFSHQAKEISEEVDAEASGQGILYVSLDSGLVLKQVMEGPIRLHGEKDSPDLEATLTGKMQYDRYMRKRTASPPR